MFHSDKNIKSLKINTTVVLSLNILCERGGRYGDKMAQTSKSHQWGSEVHLSTSLTQWICDCYLHYLSLFFASVSNNRRGSVVYTVVEAPSGSLRAADEKSEEEEPTACIETRAVARPRSSEHLPFSLLPAALTGKGVEQRPSLSGDTVTVNIYRFHWSVKGPKLYSVSLLTIEGPFKPSLENTG